MRPVRRNPNRLPSTTRPRAAAFSLTFVVASTTFFGCAEGPLYTTGYLSPYAIEHWKKEEGYGPTIHALREEQVRLREAWPSLSPELRANAIADLGQKYTNEANQTLKLEILETVSLAQEPEATAILLQGTSDRSELVRIKACDKLAGRTSPEATIRLRELSESDAKVDVRLAAIRSLSGDSSRESLDVLGRLLEDDDPAIQFRTMATLETTTGQALGRDRRAWSAYLAGETPEIRQASWFEGWSPF